MTYLVFFVEFSLTDLNANLKLEINFRSFVSLNCHQVTSRQATPVQEATYLEIVKFQTQTGSGPLLVLS